MQEEYLEEVKLTLEQLGADEMDALRDIRVRLAIRSLAKSTNALGHLHQHQSPVLQMLGCLFSK